MSKHDQHDEDVDRAQSSDTEPDPEGGPGEFTLRPVGETKVKHRDKAAPAGAKGIHRRLPMPLIPEKPVDPDR